MGKKGSSRQRGAEAVKGAMEVMADSGLFRKVWKPGNKAVFLPGGRVFSQSQDILEAFDVIAVTNAGQVALIQITHAAPGNRFSLVAERRLKAEGLMIDPRLALVMVWGKIPRKGWIIYTLWPNGWHHFQMGLHGPLEDFMTLPHVGGGA